MPYFIYILLSKKDNGLYVGCTLDVDKRLKSHNYGKVYSTKNRRPLILIHKESFDDKADAFNRERFLKSLWGSREKKKNLEIYINKIGYNS
jgi:putative endonuclease